MAVECLYCHFWRVRVPLPASLCFRDADRRLRGHLLGAGLKDMNQEEPGQHDGFTTWREVDANDAHLCVALRFRSDELSRTMAEERLIAEEVEERIRDPDAETVLSAEPPPPRPIVGPSVWQRLRMPGTIDEPEVASE